MAFCGNRNIDRPGPGTQITMPVAVAVGDALQAGVAPFGADDAVGHHALHHYAGETCEVLLSTFGHTAAS